MATVVRINSDNDSSVIVLTEVERLSINSEHTEITLYTRSGNEHKFSNHRNPARMYNLFTTIEDALKYNI